MWETLFGKMVLMQRGSPLFEKLGKLCDEPPFVKNIPRYVGNPFWKNDPHAAWEPPF